MDNRLNTKRDISLDIIKTIAIIGVPLIHAAAVGFYGYPIGSGEWLTSVFWGNIIRASVPLFLMVTGALFLDGSKEITGKRIFTKYLLRIVAALIVWAILYEVMAVAIDYKVGNVTDLMQALRESAKNVVFFRHHFHLYYLQIVIIVYAMFPIMRVFTSHATRKQMKYAILLWGMFTIIYPFVRNFAPFDSLDGIPAQYAINMTYGAVGYCLLGYYFKKYGVNHKYQLLYIPGIIITIGGTIALSIIENVPNELFYSVVSPGVFFMAIGIYTFIVGRSWKGEGRVFVKVSKASFCIYLVHDVFNIIFAYLGFDAMTVHPILSVPLLVAVNFALSYLVYLILRKIPVVNKYLI